MRHMAANCHPDDSHENIREKKTENNRVGNMGVVGKQGSTGKQAVDNQRTQ